MKGCFARVRCLVGAAAGLAAAGVQAANWYVDADATGAANGRSWQDAWTSFPRIVWGGSGVGAGDVLFISGGTSSKTYRSQLRPTAGGAAGAPITIRVGQTAGHSGKAVITTADKFGGLYLKGVAYVTIDGEVNGSAHLVVRECPENGVTVAGQSHDLVLKHVEIANNGDEAGEHGLRIGTTDYFPSIIEVSHCVIHDNYQDQINGNRPNGRAPAYGCVKVHDCAIYNIADDGFQSGIGGVDFYRNRMYGRQIGGGKGHPDGLQFMNDRVRIFDNVFYNFAHDGKIANAYIFIDLFTEPGAGRPMSDILVYNNLVYDEYGVDRDYIRGVALKVETNDTVVSVSDVLVANNTFVGVPAWGVMFTFNNLPPSAVKNVAVLNNVFLNCAKIPSSRTALLMGLPTDTFTMGSYGDNVSVVIDYNCMAAGREGSTKVSIKGQQRTYEEWVRTSGCQRRGVFLDPLLDERHRPRGPTSPLVDAGVDLSHVFQVDCTGLARPQGKAWDIGAYERPISPR